MDVNHTWAPNSSLFETSWAFIRDLITTTHGKSAIFSCWLHKTQNSSRRAKKCGRRWVEIKPLLGLSTTSQPAFSKKSWSKGHRITESLRYFANTFRIIESTFHQSPPCQPDQSTECNFHSFLEQFQGWCCWRLEAGSWHCNKWLFKMVILCRDIFKNLFSWFFLPEGIWKSHL